MDEHRQRCGLHDHAIKVCCGKKRGGQACISRATIIEDGFMPTCRIHRLQLMRQGTCRSVLECGFECGRIFETKPHDFQLCSTHRESLSRCYFLKMPPELRYRVYQYLLPGKLISVSGKGVTSMPVLAAGKSYMAILRTNRHIHDEATQLLYGSSNFTIRVSRNHTTMCGQSVYWSPILTSAPPAPSMQQQLRHGGNHALQDYQMQLMLLERQNQLRLRAAGNEIMPTPRIDPINFTGLAVIACTGSVTGSASPADIDRIWLPALAPKYFDMIQSFVVDIALPSDLTSHELERIVGDSDTAEWILYDHIDNIHRLIERLLQQHGRRSVYDSPDPDSSNSIKPPTIWNLEISISLGGKYDGWDPALLAARKLLKPFRRLRGLVKTAKIGNVSRTPDLKPPDNWKSEWESGSYIQDWITELTSDTEPLQVAKAKYDSNDFLSTYWHIVYTLRMMRERGPKHAAPENEFAGMIHRARVAREEGDGEMLREVCEQVEKAWGEYKSDWRRFVDGVEGGMGMLRGEVWRGEDEGLKGED
jgi:hypothetical protein